MLSYGIDSRLLAVIFAVFQLSFLDGKSLSSSDSLKKLDERIQEQDEEFRNQPIVSRKTGTPLSIVDLLNYDVLNVSTKLRHDVEDPTSAGALYEGDIDIDDSQIDRNAIIDLSRRWQGGFVPYVISDEFSATERSIIARGIGQFHLNTCVRFLPHTNEADYVFIRKASSGCGANVGRVGGSQYVSLSKNCVMNGPGIVEHELMHVLGFWHEQSRYDRDDHVTINWDNIKPGRESNFKKYSSGTINHLDTEYDLNSILHYGPYSFAIDRSRPTIQALRPRPTDRMGQRLAFSENDIYKVNRLYECL